METLKYTLRFTTPAFLGNAQRQAQWRTPPIKALLRQWWRVVWAAQHGFRQDTTKMRCDEGLLFGNAWLKGQFRKSEVRIRLSRWEQGQTHFKRPRPDLVYLGYGPLSSKPGESMRAIGAGTAAELSVATPATATADIRSALALANAYGTVGGRSRNGWGSLAFEQPHDLPAYTPDLGSYCRNWRRALDLDWPHAIGTNEGGPLVWQTRSAYPSWERLMGGLAQIKKELRRSFRVKGYFGQPAERHWLAYPVTKSNVLKWGHDARLPNSLRFKVRPETIDPLRLRGVIFHVPCRPPKNFGPNLNTIERVWRRAHDHLDNGTTLLERIPA